jgi:ABC-2 type transport system ATP-binding protein
MVSGNYCKESIEDYKLSYCIETHDLTKRFPVIKGYRDLLLHPFRKKEITALSNVSIQIRKGELFGLLGPNGAGKTTLIKILCTLVLPTSGRAFVNGLDVTKNGKKIKGAIGYVVSDERSFYWRLTGKQNLKFFARLNNVSYQDSELKIKRLLELMELTDDADRMFKDYSTGMRQKLAIARGLITDPEIIFMDEPTRSLDPLTAQKVRKLIREKLVEEEKRTVIFATHNLREIEELNDRIAIIHRGEIKVAGTVGEIKREFSSDKRYVIRLKGPEDGFLKKIHSMASVKEITPISNGSLPNGVQVELETKYEDGAIFRVIKEIVDMEVEIYSFYEKEISLEEMFSKVIEYKGSGG